MKFQDTQMRLSSELITEFDSNDRKRGADYYRRGNVTHLEVLDEVVFADVVGSFGDYQVVIDLNGLKEANGLECNCPRFGNGSLCKHLWAVILQFDEINAARGYKPGLDRNESQKNGRRARRPNRTATPRWESILNRLKTDSILSQFDGQPSNQANPDDRRDSKILYLINVGDLDSDTDELELSVLQRKRRKNGSWGQLTPYKLFHAGLEKIKHPDDRRIAGLLLGVNRNYDNYYSYQQTHSSFSNFKLDPFWPPELCELLVNSKRLFWSLNRKFQIEDFNLISSIDFEFPVRIALEVKEAAGKNKPARLTVEIKDANHKAYDSEVVTVSGNGMMLTSDRILRLSNPESIGLWKLAKEGPIIEIKKSERKQFLCQVAEQNLLSRLEFPDSWQLQQSLGLQPAPILKISQDPHSPSELRGDVSFRYGEIEIDLSSDRETIFNEVDSSWFERNSDQEAERLQDFLGLALRWTLHDPWSLCDLIIKEKNLVSVVDTLAKQGWEVQLHGKPIRNSGAFDVAIESGQDWFDLSVNVDFDGSTIALPQLLHAMSRKNKFIILADGSYGRIPEDVIEKYARLAGFGKVEHDKIRFHPTQAMLLDVMLESRNLKTDSQFRKLRNRLSSFDGIKPKKPPRSFKGELRDYQTDGLGWLHFLREFHLGGCLADDMGLGKTIQVLALLEQRRTRRVKDETNPAQKQQEKKQQEKKKSAAQLGRKNPDNGQSNSESSLASSLADLSRKPSIVVVPKSLIFNWNNESAKFTPKLKILNYTGTKRQQAAQEAVESGGFDVLITTYGTMQKDIGELSQISFDYAILDESQAIKNSKSHSSKASRLLKADHRLAMTGTPIENHLGELWSLFEFLNPGLLGNSTGFAKLTNQKKHNEPQREEVLSNLSTALKPFFLRRTKEQVITELPPKTEQTLYSEMLPAQAKAYKELKEYYRVKLAKKIETEGLGRSKIHVLEALLRLRQVACDPRLVENSAKPGAKLEMLQQLISEVVADGHKVLIFSQFTTFLSLVKEQFEQAGIGYELLDGKSRKRAESVKRFQEDPSVQAFLISIKAGGYGLNLTAADYVFLLDPWWNPAVEAQAIDRAHRIGQDKPVIAYRMVCRDTVEEKILELQKTKRELAEKVIRSDDSLIRTLTSDDLQLILS